MSENASTQTGAPDELDRLLVALQQLKAQTRLSFGRLAARTHYSSSSWERFLNGKRLPTREAVEQLAGVAGADPAELLSLLDAIAQSPGGAAASLEVGESPLVEPRLRPDLVPTPRRVRVTRPWRRVTAMVGCAAAGALAGSLATIIATGTGPSAVVLPSAAATAAEEIKVGCSSDTCIERDPQAMDCQWDATTAHDTWLRGMHIELRYSSACGAVWGRIENGAVGDTVTIRDRTGLQLQATIRVDRDTYTKMLAVSQDAPAETVTVCGMIPSQKQEECSPRQPVQP